MSWSDLQQNSASPDNFSLSKKKKKRSKKKNQSNQTQQQDIPGATFSSHENESAFKTIAQKENSLESENVSSENTLSNLVFKTYLENLASNKQNVSSQIQETSFDSVSLNNASSSLDAQQDSSLMTLTTSAA